MTWNLITEPSANGNQYSAGGTATPINAPSPTQFPTPPPGAWMPAPEVGNAGNITNFVFPDSGNLVYNGDLVLTQAGTGIIVLSPTGLTAWRLLVNDDGALARQSVPLSYLQALGLWAVESELSGTGNLWSNETANGPIQNVLMGDLVLTYPGSGVILLTPGGFGPYRILIADDGADAVQAQAVPIGPQTSVPVIVAPTGSWGLLAELSGQSNGWSLDLGGFSLPTPPAIWGQDFLIGTAGSGVVCQTPDGLHSYRIAVDDSGAIFAQQVS